jgi:membrane protease YdiL (CAAX protease family)
VIFLGKNVFLNAAILGIFALLVTLFVASNIDRSVGLLYFGFGAFALFVYFNFSKLKGFSRGLVGVEFGGGSDWRSDLAVGVLSFLPFFFLSGVLGSASIGIPKVSVLAISASGVLTTVFLPAIIEELVFRGGVNGLLSFFGINKFLVWGISSFAFAGFHYAAYSAGGYVSNANPFLAAFVFGVFASVLSSNRNSLLPTIVLHGINNFVALSRLVIAA